MLDDGQESGVCIERHADDSGESWIDFDASALSLGVNSNVRCASGPVGMYLHQTQIDGPWRLTDLRALHRDLGRLLAHPLLAEALEEAWGSYEAPQQE